MGQKKLISIIICMIFWSAVRIQAQYVGGPGDGNITGEIFQTGLNGEVPNTIPMYLGGGGDGYTTNLVNTSLNASISALYLGQAGDGYHVSSYSGSLLGDVLLGLYSGRIGDGHIWSVYAGSMAGQTISGLYTGDIGDGYDLNDFGGLLDGNSLIGLYAGGAGDGYVTVQTGSVLDGTSIDIYGGNQGDGYVFSERAATLAGQELTALFRGGTDDGFEVVLAHVIIKVPDCTIVINDQDEGFGSLRYAVNCAQPGDTISFGHEVTGDTITLTSGYIKIDKNISILTNADRNIYVDASTTDRVMDILFGQQVVIEGLRLIVGQDPETGGIRNEGLLTLIDLTIINPDSEVPSLLNQSSETTQLTIQGTCKFIE